MGHASKDALVDCDTNTAMFENMALEDEDEDGGVLLPQSGPHVAYQMVTLKPNKERTEPEPHTEIMAERKEEVIEPASQGHSIILQQLNPTAVEFLPLTMPLTDKAFQAYRSPRSIGSLQSVRQAQDDEVLPSIEAPDQLSTSSQFDTPPPTSRDNRHSSRGKKSSRPPMERTKAPQRFSPVKLPVPQPTNEYMIQASLEAERLPSPQTLLIILDLNGTLLDRSREKFVAPIVFRPFVKEFLKYCLENHKVMVWSSAVGASVNKMCRQLFDPNQRKQVLSEWARDTLDLTESEYNEKSQVYKRLDKVWDDAEIQSAHPNAENLDGWSQANTILIDDSVVKAQKQPFNHIEVSEFTRSPNQETGVDILSQVVAYLEELRKWDDVSRFIQSNPFRMDQGWAWDWKTDEAAH